MLKCKITFLTLNHINEYKTQWFRITYLIFSQLFLVQLNMAGDYDAATLKVTKSASYYVFSLSYNVSYTK
jgi:hypothetical protein